MLLIVSGCSEGAPELTRFLAAARRLAFCKDPEIYRESHRLAVSIWKYSANTSK